jgi:hypothetical protein
MLVLPLVALVVTVAIGWTDRVIFWLETAGLWSFAIYWVVVGIELRRDQEHWLITILNKAAELLMQLLGTAQD